MKKALLLFIAFGFTFHSFAAIRTVTNTNDAGAGSFRNTVTAASAGDTIRFDPNLIASGSDTITKLSSFIINKGLTIIGLYNATDTLYFSQNFSRTTIIVSISSSSVKDFALDSMVIINGRGGISLSGGNNYSVKNCVIRNNSATTRNGGGIFIGGGSLHVLNSIISNNSTSEHGGGIYYFPIRRSDYLTIENCTITGNSAMDNGGGVAVSYYTSTFSPMKANLIVKNSKISENSATLGGGVACFGLDRNRNNGTSESEVSIQNSEISENTGGGIFTLSNYINTLSIENSTISGNTKGGMYVRGDASCRFCPSTTYANVSLLNSTVSHNTVNNTGGGMYVDSDSTTVDIRNSTFSNNSANSGSGIRAYGLANATVKIGSSIIADNSGSANLATNPITSLGYNVFGDGTVAGSVSTDQKGVSGSQLNLGPLQNNGGTTKTMLPGCGSVALNKGDSADLSAAQNSVISDTRRDVGAAEGNSGTTKIVQNTDNAGVGSLRQTIAVACPGDTIRFNPSLITSGSDTITLLSNLYIEKGLTIVGLYKGTDTLFFRGRNTRLFFIYLRNSSIKDFTMDSMAVINSRNAIDFNYGNLNVKNCLIKNNTTTGSGGGISCFDGNLDVSKSVISNNIAVADGGGIFFISDGLLTIDNCVISGNTAGDKGGATMLRTGQNGKGTAVITNTKVSGNSAPFSGGGGIAAFAQSRDRFYSYEFDITVRNCEISGNTGGGVYTNTNYKSTLKLENSTVSGNTGGGIEVIGDAGRDGSGRPAFTYTDVSIVNSTVAYNTKSGLSARGGGVYIDSDTNLVAIRNSTITKNSSSNEGGAYIVGQDYAKGIIGSSIIADNTSGSGNLSFNGSITSQGYNIFGDGTVSGSVSIDQRGVSGSQLNLGPLQNNGGTTKTILPGCGSVALNKGDSADLSAAQNSVISDTRRDAGAAEGYSGTTKIVQNTNNSGLGSLRQMIADACPGDTIRFNPSLIVSGSDTILLTTEIAFSKSLTIIGLYNATDTLFVSGNNTSRILSISHTNYTILDSLVLINGNGRGVSGTGRGGAINFYNTDSLFVHNSVIMNNTCLYGGGGIYTSAFSASAIFVEITNSSISSNTSTRGEGGGIFFEDPNGSLPSTLVLNNSTVSENSASSNGGGISIRNLFPHPVTLILNNSVVSGNISSSNGGGIYARDNDPLFTVTLNGSVVYGNSAVNGGGIYTLCFGSSTEVNLNNSTVYGNSASNDGGGVFSITSASASSSASVTVNNSTISGNSARNGGGIYSEADGISSSFPCSSLVTLTNSTLTGNSASTNGGGIYSVSSNISTITPKSSIIASNGSNNIYNSNTANTITSQGYNILSDASINGSVSTDQLNIDSSQLNLGPLQNNGGVTETMLPGPGSVAINMGNPSDLTDAQNGAIKGRRDVGAAEGGKCKLYAPLATAAGLYKSNQAEIDNGYLCFCDTSGYLLLGLDTNGTGAVIPDTGVQLKIGKSKTTSWTDAGGIVTNSYGGSMINREWDVQPTVQPTSPVKVKYFFTDVEFQSLKDTLANHNGGTSGFPTVLSSPIEINMYKLTNTGAFLDPHSSSATGFVLSNSSTPSLTTWKYAASGIDHSAEYLVLSFSTGGGGFGGGASPLPVDLLDFKAALNKDKTVSLTWTTASEINNSHFEVFRSTNGVDFEYVNTVHGAGNSNRILNYSSIDAPELNGVKTLFYKLKQVDFDGKNTYSNIEVVDVEKHLEVDDFTIDVYPMPLTNWFNISWNNGSEISVLITDVTGKTVHNESYSSDSKKIKVVMNKLAIGVYILKVSNGKNIKTTKLLKE